MKSYSEISKKLNQDVVRPLSHINFPLKKKVFLWSFSLQHNTPSPHPTKFSYHWLGTPIPLNCQSNPWKTERVFSSSFAVYHTFLSDLQGHHNCSSHQKINTLPPHHFPKFSFLQGCSPLAESETRMTSASFYACCDVRMGNSQEEKR